MHFLDFLVRLAIQSPTHITKSQQILKNSSIQYQTIQYETHAISIDDN